MLLFLRQSTATTFIIGPFLDATDGKTAETALTVADIDVDLYKGITKSNLTITASGGSNDMAHVANGFYSLELTTSNTDTLGMGSVSANIAAALPTWRHFCVLPANVWDSFFSTDKLQIHVVEMTDGVISSGTMAADSIDASALASDALAEIADAVWDETNSGHATAGTTGANMQASASGTQVGGSSTAATNMAAAFQGLVTGTFASPTLTATSSSTSLTGWGNDTMNGRVLTVTSGARAGEQVTITDHVETSGVLTYSSLTGAPAHGDTFVIA